MASTQNITAGVKAIKVAKVDALGNNQTLQLKETDILRIKFDDLGIEEFEITDITEYPTYYLYYVVPKQLGINKNNFLNIGDSTAGGTSGNGFVSDGLFLIGNQSSGFSGPLANFGNVANSSGFTYNNSTGFFTSPSGLINSYDITVNITHSLFTTNNTGSGNRLFYKITSSYGSLASTFIDLPANSSGSSNSKIVSGSFTFTMPGTGSWGIQVGNGVLGSPTEFRIPTSSFSMSFNSFVTSSTDINGNEVVPEPYTIYNVQNSDYNAIINNAVEARFNDFYMDVDFSTDGGIIAVNQQLILNGKAVRAQVQYSNYTQFAQISPRYLGKELTSANYNVYNNSGSAATLADGTFEQSWEGDSSYGKTAVIDKYGVYALTYRGAGKGDVWNGSGSATYLKIKYMFDEFGGILQPKNNTPYYYNGIYQFPKNSVVNIVVTDSASVPALTIAQLQGYNTIYNPFATVTIPLTTISGSFYQEGNTNPFGNGVSNFTRSISITDTRNPVSQIYQAPYWFTWGTSSIITASNSSNWNEGLYSSSIFPYRYYQRSQSAGERSGIDPSPLDITPRKGQIMYFESQSNAYIIEDTGRTQIAYFTSVSSGSFTLSQPTVDKTFYKFTYEGTEYRFVVTQSTAVNTSFISGSTVCFGSGSSAAATANSLASAINTAFWSGSFYYSSSLPYALYAYTSSNIVLINTIDPSTSNWTGLIDNSTQNYYALTYNVPFNGIIFSSGSTSTSSSLFTFAGGGNTFENTVYIKLNRPVGTSSLNGLDQFVIADETPDMNKLWINLDLTGSEPNVGAGFIYPEFISPNFETAFNTVIPNLPTF
jgi:hypothetical protein